nr:hypothetical protein [uncultured Fusobacterium sp.]
MKKLLIMAFAVLTVSAFAAEEATENTVENKNIESTHVLEAKDIANVQVQQEVSLGDSFMAAFGMSEGNVGGSSSSQTSSAGTTTAATNAAVTSSNNSVTIITPYGKY